MEKKRIDDYEPGPIPSPRPLDRFGFVKQEPNSSPDGLNRGRSAHEYEREEGRVRKWRKMIGVGGSDWKHYVRRKPHVVRRRIRKGIPDCLRGLVWQLISGSRDLLLMNPGVYEVCFGQAFCTKVGLGWKITTIVEKDGSWLRFWSLVSVVQLKCLGNAEVLFDIKQ